MSPIFSPRLGTILTGFLFLAALLQAAVAETEKRLYNIPASDGESALKSFSQQSGKGVIAATDLARGVKTNAINGEFTAAEAIDRMLDGTGLIAREDPKSGSFAVRKDSRPNAPKPAQDGKTLVPPNNDFADGPMIKLEKFEVMESKLLNRDIARSPDDSQPYVVFDHGMIESSGASSIEDFLKQRLPMNSVGATNAQAVGLSGNLSQINLRGLGSNQTLILVDGHRISSPHVYTSGPQQSDINGIPIAAVERIEVLPTTASGIYGGGATGGVINIILKRNYSGLEVKFGYDDTFDSNSAIKRLDVNAGLNIEGGKTNILVSYSKTKNDGLTVEERDFYEKGRLRILSQNPNFFLQASNPPLGSTTNIRSVNGSPLFGPGTSYFTHVSPGYTGSGQLQDYQINQGRYNFALADSAQAGGGKRRSLLNRSETDYMSLTVRRQFSARFQSFLEINATRNTSHAPYSFAAASYTLPATAPNNPFGQAIRVTVPISAADNLFAVGNRDKRVSMGVIAKISENWSGEIDYLWSEGLYEVEQPGALTSAGTAAITTGVVNVLRTPETYNSSLVQFRGLPATATAFRSTLRNITARISGALLKLPSGENAQLSALVERREEDFSDATIKLGVTAPQTIIQVPKRFQDVTSAYIESRLPLVAKSNNLSGLQELELQVALRHDTYRVTGATGTIIQGSDVTVARRTNSSNAFSPTYGLKLRPVEAVLIRSSYSRGFLPPTVNQLISTPLLLSAATLIDPKRGNMLIGGTYTALTGGNPHLQPEESASRSIGMVIKPIASGGIRLSLDYIHIEKSKNIILLTPQGILNNEALFPDRVIRNPAAPGDPFGIGRVNTIDTTPINIASTLVKAYDVALAYASKFPLATAELTLGATFLSNYATKQLPGDDPVENAGIQGDFNIGTPLKTRGNIGLTIVGGSWRAGWSMQYYDSYVVSNNLTTRLNQGADRVKSQSYHDLFYSYQFGREATSRGLRAKSMLDRVEIGAIVTNIFNESPPFDAGGSNGQYYSAFGNPRLRSYNVTIKKSF
ncbi:MAG: TonB-dependent receptor [Opitutaceae bacterium]|nr:TonB-dependent receptor [Opitutaceae bacterium]